MAISIHTYLVITTLHSGLLTQFLTPLRLCVLIFYINGGTYSLKSIPKDRLFEKLFMTILFTRRVFARNLLWEEIAENSLKSIPNERFFEELFMAILFTRRVFARNLLRGNRRRFTFCIFFDIWTGTRTLDLRLISQHTAYYTTANSTRTLFIGWYMIYIGNYNVWGDKLID